MLLTVPAFAFSTGFTDVSGESTYAESVSYLADAGILRGTASGGFAPNEKITVGQWAAMLCRAFDTEPEGVSWQEVGANAVQIAIRSGWLEPTAMGTQMVLSAAVNSIGLFRGSRNPALRCNTLRP